jgi:Raf kinase inhibitor-like YbhB/YbcL family protein
MIKTDRRICRQNLTRTDILFFVLVACCSAVFACSVLGAEPKAVQKMTLRSATFQAGGEIPRKYTCDGEDVSPQLRWENIPAGTKALALIVDDPDAPGGTWVHWVVYDLPVETAALSEGLRKSETLPDGAKQGLNDFRSVGYGGPCPPAGPPHRYYFKLYALATPTGLQPRATKAQLIAAMEGRMLGQAELMGRYKR